MRKLLSALKNGPLSPAELRTAIGIQHRQTFRENYINPAIRTDLIYAEEGLSPHDPRIRYALTDKGKNALNEVAETLHQTEEVAPQRQKVASEIAPEESRSILGASQGNCRVVSDVSAEEELRHIKVALEKFMAQKSVQTSDKLLDRRAKIIQYILRDKQVTISDLTEALTASIRTLKSDVAVLRKIGVLKHVGANKNGSWVVLLDFKGKLFAPPKSAGSRPPHSRQINGIIYAMK